MTLRAKTVSLILGTLGVLSVVLYIMSRTIVLGGFREVESDLLEGFSRIEIADAERNVRRAVDALGYRIEALALQSADWAQWDDTYRFIKDNNAAYRKSNLTDEALSALRVNLIVFLDDKARIVFSRGFDLETKTAHPIPESLKPFLASNGILLRHETAENLVSGILMLPEAPLMIASRPIVTSSAKGPIRGSLLFGCFLDDAAFAQLAHVTHLKLSRHRIGDENASADFLAYERGPASAHPPVRPLDDATMAGYTILKDVEARPVIVLRVETPRDVFRQGMATKTAIHRRESVIGLSLVAAIAATGLVLAAVILGLLEISVLSRLTRLSRNTVSIGATGDFTARVREEGHDEITSLAGSVNTMLVALDASYRKLEARNKEMHLLMDTIPAGLLSLDEELRVNPEYSRSAKRMLGVPNLEGKPFVELLNVEERDTGKDLLEFLRVFRDDLIPAESMAELNPLTEVQFGDASGVRWVRPHYFNIHRGPGLTNHILVVLEDITEEKRLVGEVAERERENTRLRAVAEDPDLFREFLAATGQALSSAKQLAATLGTPEERPGAVHEIFRGIHTIRGNAGSFGLQDLSDLASCLETSLASVRDSDRVPPEFVEAVTTSLQALQAEFDAVLSSSRSLLGDDVLSTRGIVLRLPLEELDRHLEGIRGYPPTLLTDAVRSDLLARLRSLRTVPAAKGLARALKIIPGLGRRLGKEIEFFFAGQETPLDCELAAALSDALVHLLRNAFDHGIESAEERVVTGKDPNGQVRLEVVRCDNQLCVVLEDDGRGIHPEEIKAAAVAAGIVEEGEARQLSREQTFSLIFRPGFSTADRVTDTSGRGVGMDVVQATILDQYKGEISIESEFGAGTRVTIAVPLDLPEATF